MKELFLKTDPSTKDTEDMDGKVAMLIKMTSVGGDNKLLDWRSNQDVYCWQRDKEGPQADYGGYVPYVWCSWRWIYLKEGACLDDENADFGTKLMVEMIMMMVDQDEDGKLNYEEFCKIEKK